ncbi:cytochrome-c oxidase, cbb3-type subunit III [Aerosticca soli]|jgi:cytochrome c oxidase cbb3-type subunit 3|uniref:Cbb3-type cytochrome c oxidase subunit n=1 Tax=Aerosticca soli TaxID=2010829 RepID=A0A2Z6E3K7_9GAMM|nr:cytochrome-c oxidase, cbb3-type subunit III [Aerosticca soli]BBD79341.1 cytochrome c oxidase subunit CcoP [Aerosticca soli]
MSWGWTWFVVVLTALNIGGCVWLLMANTRRRATDPKPDETGHVWDGDLTEYNKPLPRWWINLFYITIVFSIGYLIWYGIGRFAGYGHWSSQAEWAQEKAAEDARLEDALKPYAGKPIDELAKDPKAVALGRTIFANNCAGCHGSTGHGATGFPNLTDDVWYWGGTPDRILETILDGRNAVMPPWGQVLPAQGGPTAIDDTVAYVQSLPHPDAVADKAAVERGQKLFAANCVACHGPDGKGNPLLGAHDLTQPRAWLYGASKAALTKTITEGRNGVMPAWRPVLGETRVRLVGAYVWTLSPHPDQTSKTTP